MLGSLDFPGTGEMMPLPVVQTRFWQAALRAAAILLIGFTGGMITSGLLYKDPAVVVPQQIRLTIPVSAGLHFSACEEIDLRGT